MIAIPISSPVDFLQDEINTLKSNNDFMLNLLLQIDPEKYGELVRQYYPRELREYD